MSTRTLFLVAYDIRDPKRLRTVFKRMNGFGDPLQFSVFQCELSSSERQLMVTALSDIINHMEDRILIADLGRRKGRARKAVRFLGRQEFPSEQGPVVF